MQEIVTLLRHPRISRVAYSDDDRCFMVNRGGTARKARGIHRLLSTHLWPNYDYSETAAAARPTKRKRQSMAGKPWSQRHRYSTGRRSVRGQARGSLVHQELCDYARYHLTEPKKFDKLHPTVHVYTTKVLLGLRKWGLRLWYGELDIYDEHVGYATAVDLVCTDRDGVVLVEVKTGYNGCFEMGSRPMVGPIGALLSDSPSNQAMLQAMLMEQTVRQRYGIRSARGVVVHVSDDGVSMHSPKGPLEANADELYRWIADKETLRKKSRLRRPSARPSSVSIHPPIANKEPPRKKRRTVYRRPIYSGRPSSVRNT